jgi:putative hydrolase of the HAD superfamily
VVVEALLFDADGVVQRSTPDRRSRWAQLLGGEASIEPFLADVFARERVCYVDEGDFALHLEELLEKWRCSGTLAEALRAWTSIEVDRGALEVVASLRASGRRCYLASNQERHRARHMSEVLAYGDVFDGEFYSYTVGHSKPAAEYFRTVVEAVRLPEGQILFIDDRATNVDAAREVGLRAELFAPTDDESWGDHLTRLLAVHGVRPR